MKKENGCGRWIISGFMLLAAAVVLGGSLLPYFQVDISGAVALLPEDAADIFNEITLLLGSGEGSVAFSAAALFRAALSAGRDTAAGDILFSMGIVLLISYAGIVLAAVFGLARRVWGYVLAGMFSLAGLGVTVLSAVRIMPGAVYRAIPAAFREAISLLGSDFGEKFLQELFMDGIGIAWWVTVAGYALVLALAIVGIVIAAAGRRALETAGEDDGQRVREQDAMPEFLKNAVPAERAFGINIGFGELEGSEIVLTPGQRISIGRDSARCNVVVSEEGVAGVHCQIQCGAGQRGYLILDLSQTGIFIDGRRIAADRPVEAGPGTILFLAGKYAVGLI